MSSLSGISAQSPKWASAQKSIQQVRLQIYGDRCAPALIVNRLASLKGHVDIYCWYEGTQGLPKLGADFMKANIFEPLYKIKQDAKWYLYSLVGWDFNKKAAAMPSETLLGKAINRINKAAIECIYSSSFFRYCAAIGKERGIYHFISQELPSKTWLSSLSEGEKKKGITVAKLFGERASLLDCIKDKDVFKAYSQMQYVEGYYLIQEAVKRGLVNGQKKIQIAFVLANDEGKYYQDYPKDIEKMLQIDFGNDLSAVEIDISFHFFEYGDSLYSKPYIDKQKKAPKVGITEVGTYFDYMSLQPFPEKLQPMPFLRDVIHNLNGWY